MINLKKWMTKMSSGLNTVISRTNRRQVSIPADSSFSTTTFTAEIHRIGNFAILYMNILVPALEAGKERTMFTIPSSYFNPVGQYNFTVTGQVNAVYLIQVHTDGSVSIYAPSATSQQFIRGTFVIPCS